MIRRFFKRGRKRKKRRNRNAFILIGIGPLAALVLMVVLFVYGELQGIQLTYHLEESDIDSPYSIFDRVLLLNSNTKYDFLEMQDKSSRNPEYFLNETFLNKQNESLKKKYSFLAIVVDGKITYLGNETRYDDIYQGILQETNNDSEDNAHYYGKGGNRYLIKKLGFYLSDGRACSACIVTDLNVNLPHITIFTWGLVILLIMISALVIAAVIGYAYYNIILPIRNLKLAVIRMSEGDLEHEIRPTVEDEFTELYQELDSMRLVLRESIEERRKADALTKEVLGNISHDLKTPLTAIKGYAEGIMDGVASTPDRVDKYVRTIYSKAVDMAGLVDELSYFTKIYQKEETFHFAEVEVNRYFAECVSNLALDLETREIQLLYQCYVEDSTVVWLDSEKIKRVIANIIGNAVKYIYHKQGLILVHISENDSQIVVMVQDNGKGIEEDELPYIFDRFYRTDSSRNSKTGGSGLGLAIVKKIIDEHRGQIWAESVLDKGTTIYFTIPKERQEERQEDINE